MSASALPALEPVRESDRAAVLLNPLRLAILREAREPVSATEVANRLREPRQKVNYHVRQLAEAGFMSRAGTRRKRNMIEQRYRATARAYLLLPEVLGPVGPRLDDVRDAASAQVLLALTAQLQSEVSVVLEQAAVRGRRVPTLSISADVRFESPGQREAFTRALHAALVKVISDHTHPEQGPGASRGRPYRIVLGAYPRPVAPAPGPPPEGG